ncbi:hypothetical protein J6590_070033 [Homalodisca vitripennis]|nr:hypothetical protein J6590_070033 [Homalodisca vitripennis]
MIKIIKKKPSRSPVNETTVRRLLEQEESEDEMLSAIDDTDSDPDYGPSSFRDQLHTPDLSKFKPLICSTLAVSSVITGKN